MSHFPSVSRTGEAVSKNLESSRVRRSGDYAAGSSFFCVLFQTRVGAAKRVAQLSMARKATGT